MHKFCPPVTSGLTNPFGLELPRRGLIPSVPALVGRGGKGFLILLIPRVQDMNATHLKFKAKTKRLIYQHQITYISAP